MRLWKLSSSSPPSRAPWAFCSCELLTPQHGDWVAAVAFSPDVRLLASASWDGSVRVWEIESGELRHILPGAREPKPSGEERVLHAPTCFSMRPLDTLMLKLRDARPDESGETHARTQNLHPHGPYAPNPHRASLVTCRRFIPPAVKASRGRQIAFSPDSRWIVSGGDPAAIQLWDAFSGALIRTLQGHTNLVR